MSLLTAIQKLLHLHNSSSIHKSRNHSGARIKFYGWLTERIESQNHQCTYNHSFPTLFSTWSLYLLFASPQEVLGLFFFFKVRITLQRSTWKTPLKHHPPAEARPPGRIQPLQVLGSHCCCFQSHVLMNVANRGKRNTKRGTFV